MIYELRRYWLHPGDKREAWHVRFRTLAMKLFARHGIRVVGVWTPSPATEETGDAVYLLEFPDSAARDRAWAEFANDPEWQAGYAASSADGPLERSCGGFVLEPTAYSPLR